MVYSHVKRMEEREFVRWGVELRESGTRKRGRLRKRWMDCVRYDGSPILMRGGGGCKCNFVESFQPLIHISFPKIVWGGGGGRRRYVIHFLHG